MLIGLRFTYWVIGLRFTYWDFPVVGPAVVCNFFLRSSSSWVLFLGSPLCPQVGKCSQREFIFFSGPRGSRVFLSSFLILGLIFQSGNLYLDPASTWHRLGIYISHKSLFFFTCIYQTPDLKAQQNSGRFFLCESQAPQFQLPKIELPPENLYFSTGFLISVNSRRLPTTVYGGLSSSLHKGQMELKSSLHTAQVVHYGTVFTKRTSFSKCIKIPHG